MAKKDTIAPTAINKNLEVTKLTDRSISIRWEKAKDDNTAAEEIRYVVGLTEAENADDPWHIVCEEKDICEYTFTELKPSTQYAFFVTAQDKAGNGRAYEELSIDTPDTKAPTVENRTVKAKNITQDSFTLAWNPAKDNATPDEKILYRVYLKRDIELVYQLIKSDFGITSCPVTNLYDGSYYVFYVEAYDESGNMLTYGTDKAAFSAQTKY